MPNQKTGFKSVDDYIAAQPKNAQAALRRVRSIVRKAVPSAVEVISYQIPAFKVAGVFLHVSRRVERTLLALSGQRRTGCGIQRRADAIPGQQGHAALSAVGACASKTDRAHREVPGQGRRAPGEGETGAAEKSQMRTP